VRIKKEKLLRIITMNKIEAKDTIGLFVNKFDSHIDDNESSLQMMGENVR